MEYFSILNLTREPFSNSPDPEYFFQSRQHVACLQKLELSLRLRRGLNVVLGDVGTGKTTLCRQLIRKFAQDEEYETHLILDPQFADPFEFLLTVAEMLTGRPPAKASNDWQVKEIIKKYIFRRGVEEKKKVVLIIDEGQKLPEFCLEILREFLNYETNEYKLLQIAIFAQKEFEKTLQAHANFADRINLYHILGPMSFGDTRAMIRFRLRQSSEAAKTPSLFSFLALWAIYRFTGGYPRKIIHLCHQCVLAMIIQNKNKAGWLLVRSCVRRATAAPALKWRTAAVLLSVGIVVVLMAAGLTPESYKKIVVWKPIAAKSAVIQSAPVRFEAPGTPVQETIVNKEPEPAAPAPEPAATAPEPAAQAAVPQMNPEPVVPPQASEPKPPKVEAAAKPEIENSPQPLILGQVNLRRSDTLWRLIEKVYGVFEREYLNALLQANPRVKDPDEVGVGQLITVPAIPAKVEPIPMKVWWVQVDEKDRLEAAIKLLRSYPEDSAPVRIIPYWDPRAGLKFSILIKDCFFDEISAQNKLNSMQLKPTSKSKIVSGWGKDIVFYADPFLAMK